MGGHFRRRLAGMLMKRCLILLLIAAIAGALFFGWGYRSGAASVESTVDIRIDTSKFFRLEPFRTSDRILSVNIPKWLFAAQPRNDDSPATNTPENDDSSIKNDGKADSLPIPIIERTVEYRDSTYYARIVGPAIGSLAPRLDFIETYSTTTVRSQIIRDPPRWEIGPAAGVWGSPTGNGVWIGAFIRHSIGRFTISASAGYDTHNSGIFGQAQVGITIWRK